MLKKVYDIEFDGKTYHYKLPTTRAVAAMREMEDEYERLDYLLISSICNKDGKLLLNNESIDEVDELFKMVASPKILLSLKEAYSIANPLLEDVSTSLKKLELT